MGYEASSEETKEANRELNPATEEVRFLVENDNLVAEHNLKNQRTVGSFSVTKEGEFFTGIRQNLLKMIFSICLAAWSRHSLMYLYGMIFLHRMEPDVMQNGPTARARHWNLKRCEDRNCQDRQDGNRIGEKSAAWKLLYPGSESR